MLPTVTVDYSRPKREHGVTKFNGWRLWNLALLVKGSSRRIFYVVDEEFDYERGTGFGVSLNGGTSYVVAGTLWAKLTLLDLV